MSFIAPETPSHLIDSAQMRRVSLAGRLSFSVASRLALRRLPSAPDRGYLSFSFDDIPRSAWTEGGRVLGRHGVRGTFYLSGELCGKTFEDREQYHRSDVGEILAAGHEVGSHLFHHRSTLSLSRVQMRQEIELNDAFQREAAGLGFRAQSVAYPYGEVSVAAKWLCSRRFQTARSVLPGLNRYRTDQDLLRVLAIDNRFAAETDWSTIFTTISREKAWGIVLAHGVDDSGHAFSCPPARLAAAIERALAAGLSILPVAEVMQRIATSPAQEMAS